MMAAAHGPEAYPIGQTWLFDIGEACIEHRFDSPGLLHYRVLTGPRAGDEDTVPLHVEPIGPGVFVTSWQKRDGIVVVHVEDFTRLIVHSHVLHPGGPFMRFKGSMQRTID
jgi:hypothetical protein